MGILTRSRRRAKEGDYHHPPPLSALKAQFPAPSSQFSALASQLPALSSQLSIPNFELSALSGDGGVVVLVT